MIEQNSGPNRPFGPIWSKPILQHFVTIWEPLLVDSSNSSEIHARRSLFFAKLGLIQGGGVAKSFPYYQNFKQKLLFIVFLEIPDLQEPRPV